MKRTLDKKLVIFYLWVSLAFIWLWIFFDFHKFREASFVDLVFNNLWRCIYLTVLGLIFFEYTVPFVLQKRRFVIFNVILGIALLWVHMMLWSFGLYAWRLMGIGLHIYTPILTFKSISDNVATQMGYSVSSVFFFGVIRHVYRYTKLKQDAQRLRIEKQEAELNYLRSQTNPHFLFNTLNNIYSLSRDKSDLAPEAILRLSKILRFMLYETSGEYISVEQELKIINDYIALEELRYDESLRVNFNYDVEDMKQSLPPLLLIPLVENAFKHGVSETRSQPFVDIHLAIKKRQLTFDVTNSSDKLYDEAGVKEKIGLSNLRRQLQLLYTDYDLSIQQGDSVFTTALKINLASHV